ncbi:hypothetical protein [Flavobacterium sp. ZE23DGlu08]|uniref:hypothetical protein n=1 Tax=Flavobacterium sp. ZE23DGlu08 TaxID=3059026 RepID=UPI00265FB48E|nr:hypothetical protein [Flavobacterium sp. ZE23DGlu08]WKL44887.1 hypothetical protein Q1W72_04570 [Flavobacterium sp. ZE23DGlu08]
MKPELKYIGKQITIKTLKDYIVDCKLEDKVILLNSQNFDTIVLEYRDFYNESMEIPYSIIGILITEDNTKKVPLDRIGLINDDNFDPQNHIHEETYDLYDGEEAHRCGFCGNIVDENGNELYDEERARIIRSIENFENPIVSKSHGKCCRDEW